MKRKRGSNGSSSSSSGNSSSKQQSSRTSQHTVAAVARGGGTAVKHLHLLTGPDQEHHSEYHDGWPPDFDPFSQLNSDFEALEDIGIPPMELIDSTSVKMEPGSPSIISTCTMTNGLLNHPLSEYNTSDIEYSDKAYRCEGGDLNCGSSSPGSVENKHEFCSSTLPSDQEGTDGPKRVCLVCGDIASGYHYGVASCEACKAFFKRTIQGNIEYSCPANNDCEITKRRRKACQACRFQKCLQMGMLKEGVRLDRVRGGRQKYKRPIDSPPFSPTITATKKICQEDNKMLATLLSIEPEKVYAMPDPTLPDNDFKCMSTLSDLADRELVATIGWAKQVPGFANLPLGDQMNLLQATWLDILCFNLSYRSAPYKGQLVYADDYIHLEGEAEKFNVPVELDGLSRRVAQKLTRLHITKEEYVLLKGMLLLNPDLPKLESQSAVEQLQDSVHDALIEYVRTRYSNMRRVGNMLMIIPNITQQKLLARNYWLDIKQNGKVPMHKLFLEMLEANNI